MQRSRHAGLLGLSDGRAQTAGGSRAYHLCRNVFHVFTLIMDGQAFGQATASPLQRDAKTRREATVYRAHASLLVPRIAVCTCGLRPAEEPCMACTASHGSLRIPATSPAHPPSARRAITSRLTPHHKARARPCICARARHHVHCACSFSTCSHLCVWAHHRRVAVTLANA